ncbi:enoyl-CoA hydratase/isomerase family protein [bacterium]|nr:enoyl-CoA hydratase/isomerase family protein [bacterium]
MDQQTNAKVETKLESGIAQITFQGERSNSMSSVALRTLAQTIHDISKNPATKVIILQSAGDRAFCAGASFDELVSISTAAAGKKFFSGFAEVILAMQAAPQLIIARVQGKAVGGGVGLIAAADYVFATTESSVRLSELALGIGPFVIGPVVENKVGRANYAALAIDADWRSAEWCLAHGLYQNLASSVPELDLNVINFAAKLAEFSAPAMQELKTVIWENLTLNRADSLSDLLEKRAEISGRLVLSEESQAAIAQAKLALTKSR